MYDYSRLPTLVLNQIFGHLSVKERVRCKGVCRAWREEIELREAKNDTLVLHLGPYLWNIRWAHTNNRRLMKYENSFEVNRLSFLKRPLTRSLLKKTKKLALLTYHHGALHPNLRESNVHRYLGYFDQCEEIEIRYFSNLETLTFDLPKLKVLVIRHGTVEKLVLNCPSLEVLFCDWKVNEINFQGAKKLKRLTCFTWPKKVSGRLESLGYLNLFLEDGTCVSDRQLELMPNLKRLVLYSQNPQADLKSIRRQQKRYGLSTLEILFSGFRDPPGLSLQGDPLTGILQFDNCAGQLFDNYSKLVESSPWTFLVTYSALFSKFKILPSDFFERFNEPYMLEIDEVTNYSHLFQFLRCYPFVRELTIRASKVKVNQIVDKLHVLLPSLRELYIWKDRPSDALTIDLTFMRLLNLVYFRLKSTCLSVELIRRVAAKRGPYFSGLHFESMFGHQTIILFPPEGPTLLDITCGSRTRYSSIEELISAMQKDRHLSTSP